MIAYIRKFANDLTEGWRIYASRPAFAKVVIALLLLGWIAALFLPVAKYEVVGPVYVGPGAGTYEPTYHQISAADVLGLGWLGLLVGQPGWYANLVILLIVPRTATNAKPGTVASFIWACFLWLSSLLSFYWDAISFEQETRIGELQGGFFLWNIIMVCAGLWLVCQPRRRQVKQEPEDQEIKTPPRTVDWSA